MDFYFDFVDVQIVVRAILITKCNDNDSNNYIHSGQLFMCLSDEVSVKSSAQ